MAESRRKLDSKKYEKPEADADEAAQKRKRMILLLVFGVAAVAILVGMFFLSQFLSGQK